jgi:hypothetical protein
VEQPDDPKARRRLALWAAGGGLAVLVVAVVVIPAATKPDPPAVVLPELADVVQHELDIEVPGVKVAPAETVLLEGEGTPPASLTAYLEGTGLRVVFRLDAPTEPKPAFDSFCGGPPTSAACFAVEPRPDGGVSFVSGETLVDLRADGSVVRVGVRTEVFPERRLITAAQLRRLATAPQLTRGAG